MVRTVTVVYAEDAERAYVQVREGAGIRVYNVPAANVDAWISTLAEQGYEVAAVTGKPE